MSIAGKTRLTDATELLDAQIANAPPVPDAAGVVVWIAGSGQGEPIVTVTTSIPLNHLDNAIGEDGVLWTTTRVLHVGGRVIIPPADLVDGNLSGVFLNPAGQLLVDVTGAVQLIPASGVVSSAGNNALVTPSAGKRLRLAYVSYNPAADVEAAFRLGAAGPLWLRNQAPAGSIISKDLGDAKHITGAPNDPLYLNLSAAVSTIWNALYIEV